MPLADALPTLLIFAAGLLVLAGCSYQISLRTQLVAYYLTGSIDVATLAIFLLLMPGVFVQQLAHWGTARLLGLRTSKFRVWPQRHKDRIGLGSVSVQRGGAWRDSIVGMAPLIAGTILLAIIGALAFQSDLMLGQLQQGRILDTVGSFYQALGNADALVWAYLLFVIGNSMMPSRSDREPVKPLLLYLLFAVLIYFIVGLPLDPITALLGWVLPAFQIVTGAILFTIGVDAVVILALLILQVLLSNTRHAR